MIDTHAHINTNKFDNDRSEVLDRAFSNGLEAIIIPAIEPQDFHGLLDLVENNDKLYCGIGIHPHNVKDVSDEDLILVDRLQSKPKVVATGEIGLDYYYDFAPKSKQKEVFSKQIEIAKKNNKPIIVHNRETDKDIISIIKEQQDGNLNGVIHCFSSPVEILKRILDLGFNVSFTGNITFKKVDLDDVIKYVPNDRFMIETDSPYMAPVPKRGKKNEPSFVRFVAEKIAQVKNLNLNEVIEMSTLTAKKLFNIGLILCFLIPSLAFSQNEDEEYYYEDNEEYYEDYVEPRYQKLIGLGFTFGTNTIVERRQEESGQREISNDAISAIGAEFTFSALDWLQLRAGYVYTNNDTQVQNVIDANNRGGNLPVPDPNIHQLLEFGVGLIPNPGSRVEFFFEGGATIFLNDFAGEKSTEFGISGAIGATINIYEFDFGLIAINGQWKISSELGSTNATVFDLDTSDLVEREVSNFFSIVRATLYFYPKF